jgi:adenosylcobinamide-phosphate synthase
LTRAAQTAWAVVLDLLAGDPRAMPHPVTLLAKAARASEPAVRAVIPDERAGGGLLVAALVVAAAAVGAAVDRGPAVLRIGGAASAIAIGSLLDHAAAVRDALEREDVVAARTLVSHMVGRDTATLDAPGVARAVIESLGESLCDGVVAPLIALAMFGLGGAFAYKTINTLDSIFGHIEPPYTYFGRVAARLDDAANLVPARVTALLVAVAAPVGRGDTVRALRVALRDGRKHRSPNAGFGEAAMAGALGIRLGGHSTYDGVPHDSPYLGEEFRAPAAGDVSDAMHVVFAASICAGLLAVALASTRR